MLQNDEQTEMYHRALYSLDKAGAQSEYHKVAELPEEIELMKNSNYAATKRNYDIPYREGQYERIFSNSLRRTGYGKIDGRYQKFQDWSNG